MAVGNTHGLSTLTTFGAEVAEEHRHVRAGPHDGEIEHADAIEGQLRPGRGLVGRR